MLNKAFDVSLSLSSNSTSAVQRTRASGPVRQRTELWQTSCRCRSLLNVHSRSLLVLQILCASPRLRQRISDSAHLAPEFAAGFICRICYVENIFLVNHWWCLWLLVGWWVPQGSSLINKHSPFELWEGLDTLMCRSHRSARSPDLPPCGHVLWILFRLINLPGHWNIWGKPTQGTCRTAQK